MKLLLNRFRKRLEKKKCENFSLKDFTAQQYSCGKNLEWFVFCPMRHPLVDFLLHFFFHRSKAERKIVNINLSCSTWLFLFFFTKYKQKHCINNAIAVKCEPLNTISTTNTETIKEISSMLIRHREKSIEYT